jgi:chorismate mutase / prephenate dehydratase
MTATNETRSRRAGERDVSTVAFLGPEGSFAHLAAKDRFGKSAKLVPCSSVREVFDFVSTDRPSLGVVPIENSSGGNIYETIDRIIEPDYGLFIQESIAVNVNLALLGRNRKKIKTIYSHFAPLHHCERWLSSHFPHVELRESTSTSAAAKKAAEEEGAAAISSRFAGEIYDVDVLEYPLPPVQCEVRNVTQFVVLGQGEPVAEVGDRTTLVVTLKNEPGSLYNFITPFKRAGVNLSRILSRPIVGKPNSYVFFVDVEGKASEKSVERAIKQGAKLSEGLRIVGSYPVHSPYDS